MQDFKHKLGLVIPTKDRPRDLKRLLSSIRMQSYKPDEIIIVDGGDEPVDSLLGEFRGLSLRYIREYPPSLTRQRNVGIRAVDPSITLVGFLDDDVVLQEAALESMFSFWESAPDGLGGAAFHIVGDGNSGGSFLGVLKLLFLTGSPEDGVVLPSGHNTMVRSPNGTNYAQWLTGAATIWRREILDKYKFDEWFAGYGLGEDLEFSYRVGKAYRLAVVGEAQVQHLTAPPEQRDNYRFGEMEIVNRFYFVRKNPELSIALFWWASFWQVLENAFRSVIGLRKSYLVRVLGNLSGFVQVLSSRTGRITG